MGRSTLASWRQNVRPRKASRRKPIQSVICCPVIIFFFCKHSTYLTNTSETLRCILNYVMQYVLRRVVYVLFTASDPYYFWRQGLCPAITQPQVTGQSSHSCRKTSATGGEPLHMTFKEFFPRIVYRVYSTPKRLGCRVCRTGYFGFVFRVIIFFSRHDDYVLLCTT